MSPEKLQRFIDQQPALLAAIFSVYFVTCGFW